MNITTQLSLADGGTGISCVSEGRLISLLITIIIILIGIIVFHIIKKKVEQMLEEKR